MKNNKPSKIDKGDLVLLYEDNEKGLGGRWVLWKIWLLVRMEGVEKQ